MNLKCIRNVLEKELGKGPNESSMQNLQKENMNANLDDDVKYIFEKNQYIQ